VGYFSSMRVKIFVSGLEQQIQFKSIHYGDTTCGQKTYGHELISKPLFQAKNLTIYKFKMNPVLNSAPHHENLLGVEMYSWPCILNLDTRWRWVVRFTLRPLYSRRKSPQYPLDRKLIGTKSGSGRGGEEKNYCPCLESIPCCLAH